MSKKVFHENDWVYAGVDALHQAVLNSGAYVAPNEEHGVLNEFVRLDLYRLKAGLLLEIFGVELPDETEPQLLLWKLLNQLEYVAKQHKSLLWQLLAEGGLTTSPVVEYQSLIKLHGKPLSVLEVAQHGLGLLKGEKLIQNAGRIGSGLWGLALIGWSAKHWEMFGTCGVCFRSTLPGRRFCTEHSQSKDMSESKSAAFVRYRRAKKIYSRLARISERSDFEELEDFIFERVLRSVQFSFFIFGEFYLYDPDGYRCAHAKNTLQKYPRVLNRLGPALADSANYKEVIELLRCKVDPYMYFLPNWWRHLGLAEEWFACEEVPYRPVRGPSKKTQERLQLAKEKLSQGWKKSAVAKYLGVTPSTISKWIKRGLLTP